jgi:hypothetical protein
LFRLRNPEINIKCVECRLDIVENMNLPAYMKYKLTNSNPRVPELYGLPKIHKQGEAMRLIASSIYSATQPSLAKWMVQQLKQLSPVNGLYVKDSIDFCQKLVTQEIAEDEIMVSFHVVTLFPSIPIDTALEFMNNWLTTIPLEDEKRRLFMEVAECCMKLNFFMFRTTNNRDQHGKITIFDHR